MGKSLDTVHPSPSRYRPRLLSVSIDGPHQSTLCTHTKTIISSGSVEVYLSDMDTLEPSKSAKKKLAIGDWVDVGGIEVPIRGTHWWPGVVYCTFTA